jgi:Domain of unknown function (DUF4372)
MKNQKLPTASKFSIVRQLCSYIPNHLVPRLARETGVDKQARIYDEWSHIVTLCYAQVTHSIGLNDVCDPLAVTEAGAEQSISGAFQNRHHPLHTGRNRFKWPKGQAGARDSKRFRSLAPNVLAGAERMKGSQEIPRKPVQTQSRPALPG